MSADEPETPGMITVARRDLRELYEALDDLWACIGAEEINSLQPETVEIARAVHEAMWHRDTTTGSK